MMDLNIDIATVISDLNWLAKSSEIRCVVDGEEWAHEMLFHLQSDWHRSVAVESNVHNDIDMERDMCAHSVRLTSNFGRSLIKRREFHRAAYFLKKIKDASAYDRFMYFWARYLACLRDQMEHEADVIDRRISYDNRDMIDLHNELCEIGSSNPDLFDTYLLYLIGKVRRSLKLYSDAKKMFVETVTKNPAMWLAWEELISLVDSVEEAICSSLGAGKHWMYYFFMAEVYSRFNLHRNAIDQLEKLAEAGFIEIPHIMNQVAASLNKTQEHDEAVDFFKKVRKIDPYRLEQMHLFSDSLYVRGIRSELANLTHFFFKGHKFRWETCLIVANYYSLRGEHDRAVMFLHRSLKLNPSNASAWTLIGHEFMEQKNNSAACLAYRKAIGIDSHDYRGWYGLGQLFDILKMANFSLFYYQEAHRCKPDDSRMLVALGEVYERLGRMNDAQRCYLKAYKVGDVEGTALMLLAKLLVKKQERSQAALAFQKYLDLYGETSQREDGDSLATCCSFLAQYYVTINDLNTASVFAQRCLEYEWTKEEGRGLLRQISQRYQRMAAPRAQSSATQILSTTSAIERRSTPATPASGDDLVYRIPLEEIVDMGMSSDESESESSSTSNT